jgi:Domain of unknown function DUF11
LKKQSFKNIVGICLFAALSACGGGGGGGEPSPTPVVTLPDLAVSAAPTATELASGESTIFSTSVANQGTAEANGVELKLTLPAALSVTSVQCTATGGATCPSSLGSTMTVASLPINGRLNFSVNVLTATGSNGPLSWTWAASNSQDTTPANNSAAASQNVYSHNLAVAASAPTGPIAAGGAANFEVKVNNSGASSAKDVMLTITPDSALTVSSISCVASATATCPTNLSGTISIAQLASGAELTFNVTTNTISGTNGPAVLSAIVQAKGDTSAVNNSSQGSASVYSANLSASLARLTAAESQDLLLAPTTAGQLTYRATINNAGPGEAKTVSVALSQNSDTTTWISCAATGGAVCPSLTATPVVIPTIVSGGTLNLIGRVNAALTSAGSATANLVVTAAGDPSSANNSSSVETTADTRNGSYSAFGFNGQRYDIEVNLNSGAWLVKSGVTLVASGYARDVNGSFNATSVSGLFGNFITFGFRIANGILIGNLPLLGPNTSGTGLVASKNFVGNITELSGTLNFFASTISNATGNTESAITTGEFRNAGTQFVNCSDATITNPVSCPPASLRTYAVVLNGFDFTATNVIDSTDVIPFRVVKINSALVYLRASTLASADKRFTIGMTVDSSFTSSPITMSVTNVSSVRSGAISANLVRSTSQAFAAGDQYEANLIPLSGISPPSIRASTSMTPLTLNTYIGQSIFVMQGPLYAAIGVRGGGIAGRIEVGLFQ